ncbi:putative siderophore transport system permease protein YfhA [Paraconexibacter sp. AEG42_29]|uniref:Siderophore transport system permease protein YfhA n=1 Tax=Paraconexibacter sp. AEG42_29 TaxID=2997339 RepID=A0AAU7ATZ0_9ACTN
MIARSQAPARRPGSASVRTVLVTGLLALTALAAVVVTLTVGDFPIAIADVPAAVLGDGPPRSVYVVQELRLPRAICGLAAGAALGASGCVFQRVAGNVLASPDVIGINAGAATAAVIGIVWFRATGVAISLAALAGALVCAVLVYGLAYRRGLSPYRLVLVGIGVAAALGSVTSYVLTRADLYDARAAEIWLTGSLVSRDWTQAWSITVVAAVLIPLLATQNRQLRSLELGDDLARLQGTRVEAARAVILVTAVALAAAATAVAGPVAFVALVAPQIARRLIDPRHLGLLPSAACGALLLSAADLAARRVIAPLELPVGVVTAVLGAPVLLALLVRANRTGATG